jgi:transcriptional regulator with PAS, ATPase and Fis domain
VPSRKEETFTDSPRASAPLARPEAYVFVVLECDRPTSGSSRHSLREVREVVVRRGDDRSAARHGHVLSLTLPSQWLSSEHARLRRQDTQWFLEDLRSRNGTWVNGQSIARAALADQDVIEIGRTLMVFRAAMHAPAAAPVDLDTRAAPFEHAGIGTLVPAIAGDFEALASIAASPLPVLLRGETGTGKELLARFVHSLSGRTGAFVPVNCGGIPSTLVESHLFGHTKGAFSGAAKQETGFVQAASGGTLFLDEIGDLPPASQAALLRALQESEVVPVGSSRAVRVDLRVVAATHQPLEALIERGVFRADLLARLDGFTFTLPPLRERREDIGLLVAHLLQAACVGSKPPALSPEVGRALLRYHWPLNIRELGHALSRACALARGGETIELSHLPAAVRGALEARAAQDPREDSDSDDLRLRAQLEALLVEHKGNIAQVARALGKARMQVHRWLKRFEMDPERYRS